MEAVHVIKRPILTEKSTFSMNEQKRYCFLVDPRATKVDIKKAVEDAYKVRVESVSTQVRKGRWRRLKYGLIQEPITKKATVRLHEEDTIDLF
ncbi:MAG: 50S ribosomal protein L23 [Phycisphaerales bacterium]